MFLRLYPPMSFMALVFCSHERTLASLIYRAISCIDECIRGEIQWPTDDQMDQYQKDFASFCPAPFENIVCSVDGSEIQILRPSSTEAQRKYYLVKKK